MNPENIFIVVCKLKLMPFFTYFVSNIKKTQKELKIRHKLQFSNLYIFACVVDFWYFILWLLLDTKV